MVSGMKRILEEILRALLEQKTALGGRRPQLVDIVKMIQLITPLQPTFMCFDALDEGAGVQRVKLLNSLNEILKMSPGTSDWRAHVRAKIKKRLAGRLISGYMP